MSNSNNLTELFRSTQASSRRAPKKRTIRPLSQAFTRPPPSYDDSRLSQSTCESKYEPTTPKHSHNLAAFQSTFEYDPRIKSDTTTLDVDEEMEYMMKNEVLKPKEPFVLSSLLNSFSTDVFPSQTGQRIGWQQQGEPCLVAHSPLHQDMFDKLGLAWGVQWEFKIARMVTTYPGLSWDDVRLESLSQLCGSCSENAPLVPSVLFGQHPDYESIRMQENVARPLTYASPWEEYDLEEESLRSGSTARLGVESDYFGGKIDQILRLTVDRDKGYQFRLMPPSKSKSFRFRRYLGSRRLLDIRFSEKEPGLRPEELRNFLIERPLVINGRVFRAFYARRTGVHLVETDEDMYRQSDPLVGDHFRTSLLDFIEWHNPLHATPTQTLTKWASRFALGFSSSQPGISFAPANILFIDDIVAPGQTSNSAIMTDGAGYINLSALHALTARMKWNSVPVTVQARFGGAKGLFILHPSDRLLDDEPRIYIRPSQIKVKLHLDPSRWCPSQRILDVLARGSISTSVQVTDQVILNLSHNDVDTEIIKKMTQDYILNASFIPFLKEDRMPQLWEHIYNQKRVQESRLKGLTPMALARAQGLIDLTDENEEHALSSSKFFCRPDPHSGAPPSKDTEALSLIQSSFDWRFYPLFQRLESIQKSILFGLDDKCHLHIPNSALAFIIPDPLGILEEGEIFCGFQNPVFDHERGKSISCAVGPVLVTRNPCILPSDIRKVMAVDCPQLWTEGYHDVIVFSVKGDRSLASMLGGGDYDGDKVVLIWEDAIVTAFRNSPTEYPDLDVSHYFMSNPIKMQAIPPDEYYPVLEALLAPLLPNQVGMYGNWHMKAAKQLGLDDPEVIRLGNIFTTCLDAVKTGLSIHQKFVRRYPPKLTVIEELQAALDQYRKQCEDEMRNLCPYVRYDEDLRQPYREAQALCERVPSLKPDLDRIVQFVEKMRNEFKDDRNGEFSLIKRHGQPRFARPGGHGKRHSPGEMQECKWAASEAYNLGLPKDTAFMNAVVPRIAASYAYTRDHPKYPTFSFTVAWSELCKIKAEAKGQTVTMTSQFADVMAIPRRMREQLDLIYEKD